MPRTKQEPGSRQSSGRYAYLLPGLSDRGYENTLMVWMSLSWLWNQCWLPSCFLLLFFFQDSSLIKIKIWSRNLGPRELFISLHSYKGILLFPAFLLKDTECKSLSRMGLFETLRTVVCRLLCPWDSPGQNTGWNSPGRNTGWNSPGQNTGVGSRCLLQGSSWPRNWSLLHCRQILYQLWF